MKPASSRFVSKWSLNTGLRRPRSYYWCVPKQHSCDSTHSKLPGLRACVIVRCWIPLVIPVLIMFPTRCSFGACSRPQLYKDVGINAITCPVICPAGLLLRPSCIRCGKSVIIGKRYSQCSGSIRKCGMPAPYSMSVVTHTTHLLPLLSGTWGREGCQLCVKNLAAQGDLADNDVNPNSVTTFCIWAFWVVLQMCINLKIKSSHHSALMNLTERCF